ncbi:uncharacterized protein LOC123659276 [Melitaea cinxia]|uniref:uncharacterized protein LOC123659276 n=1 Tax=Melitaea cinxia TaxID=113334 RepID=UPI001E2748AB|nr:uncharacterized protein LOC123659276 [Melitaea cinxia]
MALYGAPVFADALASRDNKALLRRPQRAIAVRAIRGYRTVSWTAATLLAGDPPWELQAEMLARVYAAKSSLRAGEGQVRSTDRAMDIRAQAQRALMIKWEESLGSPAAGTVTVDAIRPHLSRWVQRRHGVLTFRLTQVLTGHGCFEVCITNYHRSERLEVDTPRILCAAPRFLGEHQGNQLRLGAYIVQPVHHTPEQLQVAPTGAGPTTQSAAPKVYNLASSAFIK